MPVNCVDCAAAGAGAKADIKAAVAATKLKQRRRPGVPTSPVHWTTKRMMRRSVMARPPLPPRLSRCLHIVHSMNCSCQEQIKKHLRRNANQAKNGQGK